MHNNYNVNNKSFWECARIIVVIILAPLILLLFSPAGGVVITEIILDCFK